MNTNIPPKTPLIGFVPKLKVPTLEPTTSNVPEANSTPLLHRAVSTPENYIETLGTLLYNLTNGDANPKDAINELKRIANYLLKGDENILNLEALTQIAQIHALLRPKDAEKWEPESILIPFYQKPLEACSDNTHLKMECLKAILTAPGKLYDLEKKREYLNNIDWFVQFAFAATGESYYLFNSLATSLTARCQEQYIAPYRGRCSEQTIIFLDMRNEKLNDPKTQKTIRDYYKSLGKASK